MSSQTYRYYALDGLGHLHLPEFFDSEDDVAASALIAQMHQSREYEIWQDQRLVAKHLPGPRA